MKKIEKIQKIEKQLEKIPTEIIDMYGVKADFEDRKPCIYIFEPSFVNIDADNKLTVRIEGSTVRIINKKVYVTLWMGVKTMHVTVL